MDRLRHEMSSLDVVHPGSLENCSIDWSCRQKGGGRESAGRRSPPHAPPLYQYDTHLLIKIETYRGICPLVMQPERPP